MSGSNRSRVNKRLKTWPGWALMVVVLAAFLVVGGTRSTGPQTQEDRVDEITRRLACPVCSGESVFESQNNASRSIRNEVTSLVNENELSDGEILAVFETRNAEILLVPKASGLDALVWVLPVMCFVIGVAALAFAFRRWKLQADGMAESTEADRELVAAALSAEAADEPFAPEAGWPTADHIIGDHIIGDQLDGDRAVADDPDASNDSGASNDTGTGR